MPTSELSQVSVRLVKEPPLVGTGNLNTPESVVEFMSNWMGDMDREMACVLSLRSDMKPINVSIISIGSLNESLVHPREVMKSAILSNAAGIMLFHNHPSGNLTASQDDIRLTDRIFQAGEMMGIPLVDHIIIGHGKEFFSFREKDILEYGKGNYATSLSDIRIKESNYIEKVSAKEADVEYVAAPAKRNYLEETLSKLEDGVKEFFNSDKFKEYLNVMSKFHRYSFNNTMLIAMQKPEAQLVGSFTHWKSLGRWVNKGEKGIKIVAPAPVKEMREKEVIDADGNSKKEEVEVTIPRYRVVNVFDISQTSGEDLPELGVDELSSSVADYKDYMNALEDISEVPMRFAEIEGGAKGFYSSETKEIVIKEGMSESQNLKTAIHELGHSRLHDHDLMKAEGIQKDTLTKEVEAESVAYAVCQYFGIDTSDYSFPYIASWSSDKDMKELRESMDTIRTTASSIITDLSERLAEITKERDAVLASGQVVQSDKRDSLVDRLKESKSKAKAILDERQGVVGSTIDSKRGGLELG